MRLMAKAVLLGAALSGAMGAGAQARGPSAEAAHERSTQDLAVLRADQRAALDAWLRRLVARFRGRASLGDVPQVITACSSRRPGMPCDLDSGREVMTLQPDAPQWFVLDCAAIGEGAGVSCHFESTEGTQSPTSLALLLGVDPDAPGIRMLWVDSGGNAMEFRGPLSGDTAKLESPCASPGCEGQMRMEIHAPSQDKPVEMSLALAQRARGSARNPAVPIESRTELQRLPRAMPVLAAAESPQAGSAEDELDEVLVLGQRPERNRDDIAVWLRRLAGRFSNSGTIAFGESGDTRVPVAGATDCARIGEGAGIHCVIQLEAPNVVTNLKPGAFMLGIDLETPVLRYTSIDDTGTAVGTTGELRGDTALFRTPCASTVAKNCVATTRITAKRGADSIRLQVEIRMDGRVTSRYDVAEVRVKQPGR
jgi:hypothetical protein